MTTITEPLPPDPLRLLYQAYARPTVWSRVLSHRFLLIALGLSSVFGILVGVQYARTGGAFNSPDDASNYATAQAIVETGRPWLDTPNGILDEFDLLHPRAFTSVGDRAIPIQPLLTAVLHAGVWAVTGTYAVSAGLFAALGLLGWIAAFRKSLSGGPIVGIAAALIAMPILYWLTRQYFTMSTYLLFMGWSVFLAALALETQRWKWGLLAGIAHGLALAARPDLVFMHLAAVPLFFLVVRARYDLSLPQVAHLAILPGVAVAVTVAFAVLGPNFWLFDDPFRFGYDVVRENEGFDQPLALNSGFALLDSAAARLFPFDIAGVQTIAELAWRYTFQLNPIMSVAAVLGFGLVVRRRRREALWWVLAVALFLAYVFISRSSLSLQGSTAPDPRPSHSLVRYFMPASILIALGAGAFLLAAWRAGRDSRLAMSAFGVIAGAGILLAAWQTFGAYNGISLVSWADNLSARQQTFETIFGGNTEDDALIVSPTYDKFAISTERDSLSWTTVGPNNGFRPTDVAETIVRVHALGTPVYIWDTVEVGPEFTASLCDRGLWIEIIQPRLFRVVSDDGCQTRFDRAFGGG